MVKDKNIVDISELNNLLLQVYLKNHSSIVLDHLVYLNQRLVYKIANKYLSRCNSLTLDDLVITGTIGLMESIKRFRFEHHTLFSTYAGNYISGKILTVIYTEDRMIRIPKEKISEITKVYYVYNNSNSNIKDICSTLNMNEKKITTLMNVNGYVSLDTYTDNSNESNNKTTFLSFLEDKSHNIEEQCILQDDLDALKNAIHCLSKREIYCIIYRYGFHNGVIKQYKELGKEFGVTGEAVRQIEQRALRKLKKTMYR